MCQERFSYYLKYHLNQLSDTDNNIIMPWIVSNNVLNIKVEKDSVMVRNSRYSYNR